MKLICPNQKLFSNEIKSILRKKFICNFLDLDQNKLNKVIHKYDIVLTRFSHDIKYKKETKIRYIISPTTGENHIDKMFFKDNRIKIITLKNEKLFLKKINASSELTVLLILSYLRNFHNILKKNKISFGQEINNKKIGIIGYGRIGKKVYKILNAFGAKLYIYDIKNIKQKSSLNFILKNCDIISIHIPLNEDNKNFFNKNKLSKLKKGCLIVNTSRGEIIDETNLIKKLKSRYLSYATDVLSYENKRSNGKLKILESKIDNLLITPHIGGLTNESIKKTDKFIINKFLKYYEK